MATKKGFSFKTLRGGYAVASPFSDQGAAGGAKPGPSGDSEGTGFCWYCCDKTGPGLHKVCDRNAKFNNLKKWLSPKTF